MKPHFFLLFLILGWLVACRRETQTLLCVLAH